MDNLPRQDHKGYPVVMDERLNRVIDYFEAWELVQLLGIGTDDIVEKFPDDIEDKLEALEEVMDL